MNAKHTTYFFKTLKQSYNFVGTPDVIIFNRYVFFFYLKPPATYD